MKIAYTAASMVPSLAANSVHVMRMASAFSRAGHDVTLYLPKINYNDEATTFEHYGTENTFSIQRVLWPKIRGRAYVFAAQSVRLAKKAGCDLFYSRSIAASAFAIGAGLPTVLEMHGPYTDKSLVEQMLFKWLIRQRSFSKLVVISGRLKKWFEENNSVLHGRITCAHDGADIGVKPAPASGPVQKAGYFGGLYDGRGIDVILNMARCTPSIDYIIYGGTEEDVARWKLAAQTVTNFYLKGHAPPGKVMSLMRQCDVLLAPYQNIVAVYGGSGNTVQWMSPLKLFEYMAAGRAIICSDVPVLREILTPCETAIMPEAAEVNQWIAAISALDSPDLRTKLQTRAYERVEREFSWNRRAENVLR